ncbi:MAG: GIY-YIG nuclease family protein [Patescibacteria group bacterium]|nr:GIY-YIG nuclease family protein [Patescibacteria group bacterium]
MISRLIQKIKKSPLNPGVYIFYHGDTVLYVGKASNLRNRLKSYLKVTDIKTKSLHEEATRLETRVLRSNIEALIVESRLIKTLKPKYNVLFRDDKNYFYVAITKETFPHIYLTHQPLHRAQSVKRSAVSEKEKSLTAIRYPLSAEYIGPFTDGNALKAILRMLRRSFPYCTCKPHLRICLNAQIGNCPGYCCNKQETPTKQQITAYRRTITKIRNILSGKNRSFLKTVEDPYNLLVLEKIWAHQPYLETGERLRVKGESEKQDTKNAVSHFPFTFSRAECYDNSHFAGKEAVGAMTAWRKENGAWTADKNSWRKFKHANSPTFAGGPPLVEDDPAMMEDMIARRLNHPEWTYPDLMIIDGGITQFRAAKRALEKSKVYNSQGSKVIKVISFAKPNQEIYGWKPLPVPLTELPGELQKLVLMADQNTHNFVIRYHRKTREKKFLIPNS